MTKMTKDLYLATTENLKTHTHCIYMLSIKNAGNWPGISTQPQGNMALKLLACRAGAVCFDKNCNVNADKCILY